MLRVPLDHAPSGPTSSRGSISLLRPLLTAGLVGGEARAAALHLTAVVRGTAQISMDMTSAHKTEDGIPHSEPEVAQTLVELIDPHGYPALTAVYEAEAVDGSSVDGEALPGALSFSVERFLDGVEAWVAAKQAR